MIPRYSRPEMVGQRPEHKESSGVRERKRRSRKGCRVCSGQPGEFVEHREDDVQLAQGKRESEHADNDHAPRRKRISVVQHRSHNWFLFQVSFNIHEYTMQPRDELRKARLQPVITYLVIP